MKAVILALLPFLVAAEYKDELARNKMFPAAVGAYETSPAACIANNFQGGKIKRRIDVECDETKIDTCVGYSAYSEAENIIILSFRGTTRNLQLVMEGEETIFAKHVNWSAGGQVSKYFNDGFIKIWNKGMKDDLSTLATKYPKATLYVTGHSLGGAMAALAASYIVHNKLFPESQTILYTFGEPRVGNKAFAESMDKQLKTVYRVTHYKDIVPHIPMQYLEHYEQHEAEVFYKENMAPGAEYTVCSRADEGLRCSDKEVIELSFSDHVTYFSVDMDKYTSAGCVFSKASRAERLV